MRVQVGQRYSRLTVIANAEPRGRVRRVLCRCDCGTEKEVDVSNLTSRHSPTRSCGCMRIERIRALRRSHGEGSASRTVTHEYRAWQAAKGRCFNTRNRRFADYGGRGITMCDEWRNSYPAFLRDMGRRPTRSHSLDRIDNDGDYEPGNCRWATSATQTRNARSNVMVTALGETLCVSEWSERTGINRRTISARLRAGWATDVAVTKTADR